MLFPSRAARKALCLFIFWFALAACDSSDPEFVILPVGPTPIGLGENLQLVSTRPEVIWIVIGGPEKGTIDPFGLYTAPPSLPDDPLVTILGQDGNESTFAFIELTL
jgi:hypothetical protein